MYKFSFYRSKHMPSKSTFIPRIKVPNQFSNITLRRPSMGLKVVSSHCLSASIRKTFTNCPQDYKNYDTEVFNKQNKPYISNFRYVNSLHD